MLEDCVGIVYSMSEGRVCCIEGSNTYNNRYRGGNDIEIIHIPTYRFDALIKENPDIEQWSLNKILTLRVKKS